MVSFNNILFLDIETVPQYTSYNEMPEEWKLLWDNKAAWLIRNNEEETVESIYNRAGIYAEFGKVVCISCGILAGNGNNKKLIMKSFYDHNEQELLLQFCDMLGRWATDNSKYI